ncbi:uncharacterized protein [Macrobrachium rosenbergii]|uniref:uncharacterized protein n=1 Tax=Macrobrachium rosenbergii TaxID=79674 RepID=UPI0034D7A236
MGGTHLTIILQLLMRAVLTKTVQGMHPAINTMGCDACQFFVYQMELTIQEFAKEDLKSKEDDTKPSLSPVSDKANSPTWSITKTSHLDEEEAEDTKSSLSEKVMGDTYKPLEEIEWPSCFPAPPSSPSNTSSLPSHDYLHEISPSPPPDFKHEASPSPPSSMHNASTLPLPGRHREPIPPVPTPELPHHILACKSDFQSNGSKTMTISRSRRRSHDVKTSPNQPRRLSLQTTKSSSPPSDYRWMYINDIKANATLVSRSPIGQNYHSPSPPSPQSVITLSPAKLQCDTYYSPTNLHHPPSSPIQMVSSASPLGFQQSNSSSSSASQQDSSISIVYNASPSPPLQNLSNDVSPEPSIREDVQSGSPSQSTPKSASLDEITVHHCSISPPELQEHSLISLKENTEEPRSQPPTPPPLPEFFEEDNPPTPPPIPEFFETESPSLSPVENHYPIPTIDDEEEQYDNVPPTQIVPIVYPRPRLSQPNPLYVIQESPSPQSSFETKQESPLTHSLEINDESPPPEPIDVIHKSPTVSPPPPETENIREETPSPPPPPPIEVVHESPPPPKAPTPPPQKEEPKPESRPSSPEYFQLPDNWPAYPPFLFGDSDFPPP